MTTKRRLPMGLFAAVDLGSRSFHVTVARVHGENIEVVDRVKEPVRLAAGIRDKAVEPATWRRAAAALARIGETHPGYPARPGARGGHERLPGR